MAEYGTSETQATSRRGPSILGGVVEPQGLSTVHEVPRSSPDSYGNGSMNHRRPSTAHSAKLSHNASLESSTAHSYHEKSSIEPQQRLRHTGPPQTSRQTWQRPETPRTALQNGHGAHKEDANVKSTPTRKEKKSGLRHTFRRIFSRRRERRSVPASALYPRHNPEEFITSATNVKSNRVESAPSNGLLRTSGLSSHPPDRENSIQIPEPNTPLPPQPERRPPERPPRPRRASVPSLILNRQEMDAADAAVRGLGLQSPQIQTVDVQNIGFAVTNGSNPKRRSRSAEALRDSEHRSSPIQWRRWRRRSDEIRYWRASSDLTSLGVKGLDSPEMAQNKDDNTTADEDDREVETHNTDFNFGLPENTTHNQENFGLAERIVTLEIKLMDFEYALSKLQAESVSPARQRSQRVEREDSSESYPSSDHTHMPIEPNPSLPPETPPMPYSQWVQDITPKPRPTSVATTLKPGYSGQNDSNRKRSLDRSTRSSLMGLTIDHYTTLITLVRNEQSARQRLEQQVSILQGRVDAMSTPSPQSHSQSLSQSQRSYSRSLSSSQRRQGFIDLRGGAPPTRQLRPRSSSYSTTATETDTDDDAFHDVYVTPNITPVENERGEYERGAFERHAGMEEGMAF